MTKEFLKTLIISRLGGSQHNIELTDEDLDLIIYQSINYYSSYSSDAWNDEWDTITLSPNTNYHELDDDIDFIIEINLSKGGAGQALIPETFGTAYENTMLGMIANDNELTKVTNPVISNVIYKDGKRFFQTDFQVSSETVVAAKVLKYKDLAPIYSNSWVHRYVVAQAKFTLGLVRSKYGSLSAPNDLSMNGNDLVSQAQTEIEKLEQEIFDISVISNGGIYIG